MIYRDIADYLDAFVRILRSEQHILAAELGLSPVHLQILHYLGRCNRYSDAFSTLSDYIGLTKGTLSQSVSLLEEKKLLRKQPDEKDRRKVHLQLTAKGRAIAVRQSQLWQDTQAQLTGGDRVQVLDALEKTLRAIQQANRNQLFGVCQSCQHLCREQGQTYCGLTQETLLSEELSQLCVFHSG